MKNYIVITTALVAIFIIGCGAAKQTTGPSDTLKKYIDAYDRKDIAAMKETYSKGTIKMYEDVAQKQKTSVDEIIKEQIEVASTNGGLTSKVQTVGEKIEGDTAVVEVKSEGTQENEKIPLVKEDGMWKLALDKYIADIQKRMLEDMNKPNPKSDK